MSVLARGLYDNVVHTTAPRLPGQGDGVLWTAYHIILDPYDIFVVLTSGKV